MSFFDLPPIIERMLLVSDKISDLNFSVGQPPQVEINGKLTPVQPLGSAQLEPEDDAAPTETAWVSTLIERKL